MPPTPDEYRAGLLALLKQQRASLTSLIEQIDATLAYDWQRGMGVAAALYGPILDQYARDLAALRAAEDDPAARLTLDWLTGQNSKLATIQASVMASADKYGSTAARTITQAQQTATEMAASDAAQLTQRSLWPAVEGAGVPPSVLFNRPNPDAVAQWVGRAGNGYPLGDLFSGFGAEATQGARQAMMLGLLTGANPKAMASGIANALGISRSRATIISRTEVLGSYRSAAHETYRANSDVLNGWIWSAGGANPCAMCMGMDGLQFSLSEELVDHPCGKCAPIPVTKSWDDILGPLGIDTSDMEETSMGAEGAYETGPEKFARMSPQQQRAIIGTKTGYEAYQRGEVELKDFIGMRPGSDGFPASYYQKSLKEMEIPTGRAGTPLVERSPRLTELERLGQLRARDFGAPIPVDEMPVWAQKSPASQVVYQIMRNGLPWNMSQHELPLLSQNIEKMLTEDLSLNVRMAALRLQDMLKQYDEYLTRYVRNVTNGASTLGKAPEFVYSPSKELERALAAARAGERGIVEQTAADTAVRDVEHEAITGDILRAEAQQLGAIIQPHAVFDMSQEEREAAQVAHLGAKAALLRDAPGWQRFVNDPDILLHVSDLPGEAFTPEMRATARIEEAWHTTPINSNPMNVALRQAANEVFGLDARIGTVSKDVLAEAQQIAAEYGDVLRAYVQATYDQTQQWFEEHGITELTLYRGAASETARAGIEYNGEAISGKIAGQAISSYSADPNHVLIFAEGSWRDEYHSLIATRVSVSEVFGTPFTSMASRSESEFLLLGRAEDAAVLSWKGVEAPDLAKALDELAPQLERALAAARAGERGALEQTAVETTARDIEHEAITGDALRAEAQRMDALIDPMRNNVTADEYMRQIVAEQETKAALLTNNPEWQRYVDNLNLAPKLLGSDIFTPDMQAVRNLEAAWDTGNVHDSPINVAIRQAAQDLFGLPMSTREIDAKVLGEAERLTQEYGGAIKAYVQATYDQTQRWFEERGITEITLYRGGGTAQELGGLRYNGSAIGRAIQGNAIASYTADPEHAILFADAYAPEYKTLQVVRVPVSEVWGTPFTSAAKQSESEFLLLGRAQDAAILSWRGSATPELNAALDELAPQLERALSAARTGERTNKAGRILRQIDSNNL